MSAFLVVLLALQQEPATQERLRQAVDAARAELEELRARARAEETRQEITLNELRQALRAEAAEVIALEQAIAPLAAQIEAERKERDRLAIELDGVRDLAARAADLGSALRSDVEEIRAARQAPAADAVPVAVDDPAAEIDAMTQALLAAVRDAGAVARGSQRITGPDGRDRDVELLRAGAVFAAYREPGGGAVGLAVKGPEGEGHRWTEALSAEDRRLAGEALSAPGGWVLLPVDVSQSLTVDASMADRSIVAFLRSGGPVMVPLGMVAVFALVLCCERWRFYAREGAHREEAVAAILRCARDSSCAEAEERLTSMRGVVARVLSACLGARGRGREAMENALQEAMLHESPRLERFLPLLAVLAGVAPMLGLLGTVAGIIATFEVISQIGRGDPALMAGGISEALVATGTGLFVAIPLLVLHSYFSGRVERIAGDAERHGASLINRLEERDA